jgi:hypothetical protein
VGVAQRGNEAHLLVGGPGEEASFSCNTYWNLWTEDHNVFVLRNVATNSQVMLKWLREETRAQLLEDGPGEETSFIFEDKICFHAEGRVVQERIWETLCFFTQGGLPGKQDGSGNLFLESVFLYEEQIAWERRWLRNWVSRLKDRLSTRQGGCALERGRTLVE